MGNRGLAYWRAGVEGRDTLDEAVVREMVAHPGFAAACKDCMRRSIQPGNQQMYQILRDMSGMFYAIFTLYLDARSGLTMSAIQQFCAEAGLSSPGRSAALLLMLRLKGFVVPDPIPGRNRARRYIPTPAMEATMREFISIQLSSLTYIEPEAAQAASRFGERAIFQPFVIALGEGLVDMLKKGSAERSDITLFSQRSAGSFILYHLAVSGEDDDTYPPRGPIRMSVTSLAKRYSVSRSHVLKLLRDAERAGLLTRDAENLTCQFTEKLCDALNRYHAAFFMANAAFADIALRSAESELKLAAQ